MNVSAVLGSSDWIALVFGLGALLACGAALLSRSLIVSAMAMMGAACLLAIVLTAQALGAAALMQAVVGAGLAPALILGALLLSARSINPPRPVRPWLTLAAVLLIAAVLAWAVLQGMARSGLRVHEAPQSTALLLAPLMLVMAMTCLIVLGFGERGAFGAADSLDRDA